MFSHLRANLVIVMGALALCCVAYPLTLLGIGQFFFPASAQGSLVLNPKGATVGSKQIAQPFTGDGYFQPRPSAVAYNAAGSGGSNWGASNPLLRNRAARILGPLVRFDTPSGRDDEGKTVQERIEEWFRSEPRPTLAWCEANPAFAAAWLKENAAAVRAWEHGNPEALRAVAPPPDGAADPATLFFARFNHAHPRAWPAVVAGILRPTSSGPEIHATFFDPWLRAHPSVNLEQAPADLVTTSGSGLDPHITLRNARWQSRRVAAARARLRDVDLASIEREVERQIEKLAHAPLHGLAGGEPIVNVLELNLALDQALPAPRIK